jgi:putative MFS transporter
MATAGLMAVFGLTFGFALILISGGRCPLARVSTLSRATSSPTRCYLPESFPTNVRGTASGATYSLSEVSTAVRPFVLLLDDHGSGALCDVITAALFTMITLAAGGGHAPPHARRMRNNRRSRSQ